MIDFPCKCGYTFSLPADQSGGLIQCPQCGLLADVPTLSDLANLNPDGTFIFEDALPPVDNITAADLHRAFSNKTTDSRGVEKDLRPGPAHYEAIGSQDKIKPKTAPRYDPVTGELIRPLQFKDETPTPVLSMGVLVDPSELDAEILPEEVPLPVISKVPIAKPQQLTYAKGDTAKQVTLQNLWLELLMPANTAVMFFIFLLFVMAYYTTSALAAYLAHFPMLRPEWPFLLANLPMWLLLAHLGCVIEEIGPCTVDELPRPLRNFSLGEDVFHPLFSMVLSIAICFVPALAAMLLLPPEFPVTVPIILLIALAGAFFFPAVVLTAVTGTTVLNLRPDRVIEVIKTCGMQYFVSILLLIPAVIPASYYLAGAVVFPQWMGGAPLPKIDSPPVMLAITTCCIYFAHFFAWHLGLMYRQHHDQFPWLAQRHVKQPKNLSVDNARMQ